MCGDESAGDRCRAGAAIGLQHIAIEGDRAFAKQTQIKDTAQRTADQALDFLRAAALLAARGFAVAACVGGAGQHAIFGRHPTLTRAALVRWHFFFDRCGAQDFGPAKGDQHRTFGMTGVMALDRHRSHRICSAAGGAQHCCFSSHHYLCCMGLRRGSAWPGRHCRSARCHTHQLGPARSGRQFRTRARLDAAQRWILAQCLL